MYLPLSTLNFKRLHFPIDICRILQGRTRNPPGSKFLGHRHGKAVICIAVCQRFVATVLAVMVFAASSNSSLSTVCEALAHTHTTCVWLLRETVSFGLLQTDCDCNC